MLERRSNRSAAALLTALLMSASAHAATLRPMDLGELAAESTLIVAGRVVDVRPVWVRGGRHIDSVVTIEVEASFKGDPGRTLSFLTPGGQIGDLRTVVPGAPDFTAGSELVLFLAASGVERATTVVGLGQGVLPVLRDAQGTRRVRAPFLVPGLQDAQLPVRVSLTFEELAQQLARSRAQGRR
jgi:hypothetical protein